MIKVHIDFETRSVVDIWETGAWIYSAHPSTHVHCIAYAVGADPVQLAIPGIKGETLSELIKDPNIIFIAHNAYFERSVWKNIMEPKYGFPPIPVHRWRCTMAKACAYGLPRALEKAADAMHIEQRKDKAGRQIMLRMAKPLPNKKGEIIYDEDPAHLKQLYEYCQQDVRTERALDLVLPDLSATEQSIWFHDQLINTRGIRVDSETVNHFISILEQKTDSLNKELVTITNGKVTKGTQLPSMKKFLADTGAVLPDLTKQTVTEAIKSGVLKPKHIQVLRLRQQLGKSSLAKYKKLVSAVDENGILRDSFQYHAASTGRWGGKLVQLQNLPVGKINTIKAIADINQYGYPAVEMMYPGKLMDTLSECIRGLLIPSEGKELLVVDYAAIEARVVMWLSYEQQGLKEFQESDSGDAEDIYVKMAQRIYNDLNLTKKDNPVERQLGKQAILGCGYGMGAVKFQATCAGYGIIISEEEARRIVNLYRTTYFNVKNYWYGVEQSMMDAYVKPGKPIGSSNEIWWIYLKDRDAIFCKLPSGRVLTYLNPKIETNKFNSRGMTFHTVVNGQWVRRDTYGGLLVENITQGVARDIMAYSMPPLEAAGFPVLMHNHDEIVSERPIGEGKIQDMIDIMCQPLAWAVGCPIVAEGFVTQRYKKG